MPNAFSIQVTIDSKGVQGVKVLGDGWEQPQAYALLEKIGPLIQQLDALVRGEAVGEGAESSKEPAKEPTLPRHSTARTGGPTLSERRMANLRAAPLGINR